MSTDKKIQMEMFPSAVVLDNMEWFHKQDYVSY